MRTGSSRSTLTPASASLRKAAAAAPGRFTILTVTAGRIRYSMPAPSSAAWAEASSSAMKATTPLAPCVVAHNTRLTPLPAIASHRRTSSPGWLSSSTVNALIWGPSPAPGPASPLTLNLPGWRPQARPAPVPGGSPPDSGAGAPASMAPGGTTAPVSMRAGGKLSTGDLAVPPEAQRDRLYRARRQRVLAIHSQCDAAGIAEPHVHGMPEDPPLRRADGDIGLEQVAAAGGGELNPAVLHGTQMNDNLAGVAAGNRGRRDVPVDGPVKPSRDPRGGTRSAVRAHDGVVGGKTKRGCQHKAQHHCPGPPVPPPVAGRPSRRPGQTRRHDRLRRGLPRVVSDRAWARSSGNNHHDRSRPRSPRAPGVEGAESPARIMSVRVRPRRTASRPGWQHNKAAVCAPARDEGRLRSVERSVPPTAS